MSTSILITGCSSGIGRAAADTLKKRGYHVIASARKEVDVRKLQTEGFECVQLDLDDSASIKRAVQETLALTSGTLDALFNNSGFMQFGAIDDLSRDVVRKQFETNVFGPMELIRLVLPAMRKQGHGRIIQNSSVLGIIALPYYGAYNASKFALEGFTNTLRLELRGTNIRVSTINPGPIESRLRESALRQFDETLRQQANVHQDLYLQMEKDYFNKENQDRRFMLQPEAVVAKLILALESKHPRAHYHVGFPANLMSMLRRLLPDVALDWFLTQTSKTKG